MVKSKSPLPKAGNTDELERLETDIEYKKKEIQNLKSRVEELDKERGTLTGENAALKKSVETAYAKIRELEQARVSVGSGESMKEGYVEIATMPYNGNRPGKKNVGGIVIPQRVDEDNITYEIIPVKTALAVMAEKNAWKKYLIEPCDRIEGDIPVMQHHPHGVYPKHFIHNRHKKSKDIHGNVEFIEVVVEESKPKE
jgi:regulator of replication initiation timing